MRKVRRKALVSLVSTTQLSKMCIECHCTRTEKHDTTMVFGHGRWHYIAIVEQYNGNSVFVCVSCKVNPQFIMKTKEGWTLNAAVTQACRSIRVLLGVPFYLKAHLFKIQSQIPVYLSQGALCALVSLRLLINQIKNQTREAMLEHEWTWLCFLFKPKCREQKERSQLFAPRSHLHRCDLANQYFRLVNTSPSS